jgi:hypothetical protein
MSKIHNRTVGVTQVTVGLLWLAVMPAFLWFMVFMEANDTPQPDSAGWRLWRALEVLLVEPKWLGIILSVLVMGVSLLGGVLVIVGIGTLLGDAQGQKWGTLVAACGIILCGIGFLFHRALLMPVVNASQNPDVQRAAEDLDRAGLIVLGAGLASMIVAGAVLFCARCRAGSAGNLPAPT